MFLPATLLSSVLGAATILSFGVVFWPLLHLHRPRGFPLRSENILLKISPFAKPREETVDLITSSLLSLT